MQSFDTKDSNKLESFDRKFEGFDTKDSEVKQSGNDFVESFDRKFGSFESKGSEVKQSANDFVESFDRKFEITYEEALPDSESFDTEDPNVSIPNFIKFHANSSNSSKQSFSRAPLSGHPRLGSQDSEKSKTDGRCKPRSQKQIETYIRNFSARKSIELKIKELDSRLQHVQSLVLSLLRLQKRLIAR